jgi:hypothetical protein
MVAALIAKLARIFMIYFSSFLRYFFVREF